jgi:cation transport ATPase
VEDVVEVRGQGIAGRLDGHDVRVGTRAHVEVEGASVPADLAAFAEAVVADGLSPVFVAVDGRVGGVAGIGDTLRPDARRTVAALRARGIRVRILSGDHPAVVARVGAELGLPPGDALGGLAPEAKRDIVAALVNPAEAGSHIETTIRRSENPAARGLRRCACFLGQMRGTRAEQSSSWVGSGVSRIRETAQGRAGAVVMVGDGVNDAAALALADVGIAVHGGTGPTIVAADVVLTREGVTPLLDILDGARRLRGVVVRNLGFSLAYNTVATALALGGFVSPLLAAVLMPISSLTVVLSSALTRTFAGFAGPEGPASGRAAHGTHAEAGASAPAHEAEG